MNRSELARQFVSEACGAPGHHEHFLTDTIAYRKILVLTDYARMEGIDAYLRLEYPSPDKKSIIVNVINGKIYVVDGNRHLISLIIAKPDLTFGELMQHMPNVVRLWHEGIEGTQNVGKPYDVYIPYSISTERLPNARIGTDYFKMSHEQIKIISANIPFDSELFLPNEKGYPLYQTAIALLNRSSAA